MTAALAAQMQPIVQSTLAIGCRAGEIHGFEWSRVDLVRKAAGLDQGTTKSAGQRSQRFRYVRSIEHCRAPASNSARVASYVL